MNSIRQSFFLYWFACVVLPAQAVEPAKPGIGPETPLIEHTAYGDSLNFDIIADNPTKELLEITQLDIEYLDSRGATLLARRLDINSGAILTLPERKIEPGKVRMIYNPFPVLPPGLRPATVRATVSLSKPDAKYLPVGHLQFATVDRKSTRLSDR